MLSGQLRRALDDYLLNASSAKDTARGDLMVTVTRDALDKILQEMYEVKLSNERLEVLQKLVQQALDALEKSMAVGADDLEPSHTYDLDEK